MEMERLLNQLVERLRKAHQDGLVSVVLYGSAAVGDHHSGFSDINILCVLEQVTPRELAASADVFHWWRGQGNPSPLLLSREELTRSTDVFPIEFHDIRERHRVLFGEDVAAGLAVSDRNHRTQLEHELRSKLLRLRQKAAGALGDKDLLAELLAESLSTFCVLFRHALLLHGVEASFRKREIVEQAAKRFGIDPAPFLSLLDLREKKIKARQTQPNSLFESYLKGIQAVITAVDLMEK
jgi:hypothetical protein